jgi:DNA-binding response OmpR family regulator
MTEAQERPRALIVEDEIVIARDLEIAMSDLGYDVCTLAPSERSARVLAMQERPDLAVVDVLPRRRPRRYRNGTMAARGLRYLDCFRDRLRR